MLIHDNCHFCVLDEASSSYHHEDSESSSGHDCDTIYDSHSDSAPTVIDNEADQTAIDVGIHYARVGAVDDENQKADKDVSAVPWKQDFEVSHPYIAPRINRWTRLFTWFTPYRQLFSLTFGLNLIGAAMELSGHWAWSNRHVTALVVGNVLIAIAIRSEWVLRLLYWVAVKTFRPNVFPLWIRVKTVGILYHIGEQDPPKPNLHLFFS